MFALVTNHLQGNGSDTAEVPRLSRETRTFLKVLNTLDSPPLEQLPPLLAREVLAEAQSFDKVSLSGIDEAKMTITSNGYIVPLNIVRPKGVDHTLPVFVFVHGGGWMLGDYRVYRRMVRDLVVQSGCVGVFVNYTRTPVARYPRAINEVYAATKWVAEHGEEVNVDGKRLAVVGNCVGGNMTAVTSLMAKEKAGPDIRLQIMMWPVLDANVEITPHMQDCENRFLSTTLVRWMYDHYADPDERNEIYASPLRASVEQLKGMPPTLIQVAEGDIMRGQGEAYGRKLDEAGVQVTTVRYNGMIHDFGLLNGLARLPSVRSLFVQAAAELKTSLG